MALRQTSTLCLVGILALALLARLAAAVVVDRIVSQTPGRLCLIEGDADGYWELGQRISRGGPYELYDPPRRILRMPGFPLLIAACQTVFGDHTLPVRCVLAVIGCIGCWGVFLLGRDLVDTTVGLLACAAVSISPPLIAFSPLLLTETAFATALTFSLIPIVRLCGRPVPGVSSIGPAAAFSVDSQAKIRWGMALAAGAGICLATYVRPTWLPVLAAAALAIPATGRFHFRRWMESAAMCLVFLILLAPWIIRNYRVSGHVVPTTLWVGPSLYDGLNAQATGDSDMEFFDRENLMSRMSEYDMNREYRRRAWDFVRQHPRRALSLAWTKALRYWSPWPNAAQFQQPLMQWGLLAVTLPLYAGTIIGVWSRRSDWIFLAATVGPVIYFCGLHLLFVGSIRYRLPAELPLWIAAVTGGRVLWRIWADRGIGRRLP